MKMKKFGTKSAAALAGLTLLASAGVTLADVSITFDVGSIASQTVGRDTVSASANTVNQSFTLGQATTVTLQNLTWLTAGSGAGNNAFVDLDRAITATINGVSGSDTIYQSGAVYVSHGKNPTSDSLNVDNLDTTEITLGQYILDITPDAYTWSQKYGKSGSYALTASVTVTQVSAVPEITTMLAGAGAVGLLVLGVGVHSKQKVIRIGK